MDTSLEGKRKQGKEEEEESDRPWKQQHLPGPNDPMEVVPIEIAQLETALPEILEAILFLLPVNSIMHLASSSTRLHGLVESNSYLWKTIQYADLELNYDPLDYNTTPSSVCKAFDAYSEHKRKIDELDSRNAIVSLAERVKLYRELATIRVFAPIASRETYAYIMDEKHPLFYQERILDSFAGRPITLAQAGSLYPYPAGFDRAMFETVYYIEDPNALLLLNPDRTIPTHVESYVVCDKTRSRGHMAQTTAETMLTYPQLVPTIGKNAPSWGVEVKLRVALFLNRSRLGHAYSDYVPREPVANPLNESYTFKVSPDDLYAWYDSGIQTVRIERENNYTWAINLPDGSIQFFQHVESKESDAFVVYYLQAAIGKIFPWGFFVNARDRQRGYRNLVSGSYSSDIDISHTEAWKTFVANLPAPTSQRTSSTAVYIPASMLRGADLSDKIQTLSIGIRRKDLEVQFERTPLGKGMY